tara:strand:- start:319 stop:528 length:210 start_codon:yes stop_codon:yes gene_type:complete
MSQHYSDPSREDDPYALPDLEIWYTQKIYKKSGYYYAYGFPGCLHDSEPVGPFKTEQEALNDAREERNE